MFHRHFMVDVVFCPSLAGRRGRIRYIPDLFLHSIDMWSIHQDSRAMSTRFQKNSAMRKASGNTTNRPEQLLIAEVFEQHLDPVKVLTEEKVHYITESHQAKWADIDVFVVWQSPDDAKPMEYLVRVMGPYHDEPRQAQKDDLQRSYLLAKPMSNIVTVCDMWYHLMPTTFKRNRKKLNRSEAVVAYQEIRKQAKFCRLPEEPKESWLESSAHII